MIKVNFQLKGSILDRAFPRVS